MHLSSNNSKPSIMGINTTDGGDAKTILEYIDWKDSYFYK